MEPWMWAIVGVAPVVAIGTIYAMWSYSSTPSSTYREPLPFEGDNPYEYIPVGGRRRKTKKSKSKHKKTKRRH